jgi:K+-transporting ATPase KdpF subunit
MKFPDSQPRFLPFRTQWAADIAELWEEGRRQKLPIYLFLGLCCNLVLAPAVFAATGEAFSRSQIYYLSALVLITVALSIYLFFVMFVPEKF